MSQTFALLVLFPLICWFLDRWDCRDTAFAPLSYALLHHMEITPRLLVRMKPNQFLHFPLQVWSSLTYACGRPCFESNTAVLDME